MEAAEQVRRLEESLGAITTSTSWRLTSPLRIAKTLLDSASPHLRRVGRRVTAPARARRRGRSDAETPGSEPARLLVDVTGIAQADPRLGIQRAVRSLLSELVTIPTTGVVCPVRAEAGDYLEAGRFASRELRLTPQGRDVPLASRPGDTYLSIDLFTAMSHWGRLFGELENAGVPVYVVLYDLLPILRPDDFTPSMREGFERWLQAVLGHATGVICISRSVADELVEVVAERRPPRRPRLGVGYFHLGANRPHDSLLVQRSLSGADRSVEVPRFLMVGTVEPRKRHLQALKAFELLWSRGLEAILVIVGKQGWLVEELASRIRNHPEAGERLFWFESAGDEILSTLYHSSSALLAASAGEGFGLPLIEAAAHKLPIVARKLPVFREIAGEHAFYFQGDTPEDLAAALLEWIDLFRRDREPRSSEIPVMTWRESAEQLLEVVEGRNWYRTVA